MIEKRKMKVDILTSNTTYICIDVEAALIRGKQYIIEIGAIKWLPDGTTDTFTQLVQPYKFKRLNDRIQQLTGITTEELLTAPTFKEAIRRFRTWCGNDYMFLTFGEFDRKVLEEEFTRNYLKRDFLFPMVDFQQKYMIDKKQKEQPSLAGLMAELGLEAETQHRALADAESLLQIFKTIDGKALIDSQRTNKFKLILSNFKKREKDFDLVITAANCVIEENHIVVNSFDSIRCYLPYTVEEVIKPAPDKSVKQKSDNKGDLPYAVGVENRETAEGEVQVSQVVKIKASGDIKVFLKEMIASIGEEVIITRTGLKSMARILRMHDSSFHKTEVMTLQNILENDNIVSLFNIGEEPVESFEKKVKRLLSQYERQIILEFNKRALLQKNSMQI